MFLYLKNVVTLKVEEAKCIGCGFCLEVCPRGVLEVKNRKAYIAVRDACLECGACARNCRAGAISVNAGVGCATAILNSSGPCGECCCGSK